MTVPKSLDAQRTNAHMEPGANERTRRRRSMICSATARPNRTRFSMRFSSHKSSTVVRSFTMDLYVVEDVGTCQRRRCFHTRPKLKASDHCRALLRECPVRGISGIAAELMLTPLSAAHRLAAFKRMRSVRGNPKDSLLVKLRGRENVARQRFNCDFGPR